MTHTKRSRKLYDKLKINYAVMDIQLKQMTQDFQEVEDEALQRAYEFCKGYDVHIADGILAMKKTKRD